MYGVRKRTAHKAAGHTVHIIHHEEHHVIGKAAPKRRAPARRARRTKYEY